MTDAKLQIIPFLEASDETGSADLPDWLLALLEDDHSKLLTHELITVSSLISIRRQRTSVSFGATPAPGDLRAFAIMII
jgi:hypothetical protein